MKRRKQLRRNQEEDQQYDIRGLNGSHPHYRSITKQCGTTVGSPLSEEEGVGPMVSVFLHPPRNGTPDGIAACEGGFAF
jgi:hypothetical protein